jgi:hypothetical protein
MRLRRTPEFVIPRRTVLFHVAGQRIARKARRLAAVFTLFAAVPCWGAEVRLTGRTTDENEVPVGQARIAVSGAEGHAVRTVAAPNGSFSIILPGPGDYVVDVQREGYFELRNYRLHLDGDRELILVLNTLHEVLQSVDVNGTPSRAGLDQTAEQENLSGTEVNNVPYVASHSLRNAMDLIPGVVQDSGGTLHFEGSSENQVYYTLNDFNIGDPITGHLNTRLAVEGIRDMEFQSARFSPEFGKGSAGVLTIHTDTGGDKFHYTATNFIPGLGTQNGFHLGNWTPRAGFSGPIVHGRAWFADNFGAEYDQSFVNGLPQGQNQRSGWSASNLLHGQVNVTRSQILFADFLVNFNNQTRAGLGPLDPVSTTTAQRSSEYLTSLKDQFYFENGTLAELGYAHSSYSDRQVPQGDGLYILSPSGRSGNNFLTSSQWASRDQALANVFLPQWELAGAHQLKVGADFDYLNYQADFTRTGYDQIGLAGTLLSQTLFTGNGAFQRSNLEASSYVVDTWRLRRNVQIEAGVRQDWDRLVDHVALAPRVSVSYSPFGSGNTKLSAGYSITHDATSLALFSRPLDQTALTTYYNPDGTPVGGPQATTFTLGNGPLRMPRSENWSAGVDHSFPHRIDAGADYLRRRGSDGFTYVNTSSPNGGASGFETLFGSPTLPGVYALTNDRRDAYDAVHVVVRQTFSGQFEWMASYTRSRAVSNAFLDLTTDQPFQVLNEFVPLPWDAPNRFLGWAYLPLPLKNWAVAVLADARTGFPFSVVDENGQILGGADSQRFPSYFELDAHIERRFTFLGYRVAVRAGVNNLTGHPNPAGVNNMVGAPQYLQFLGFEGRHLVVRVRFFGRAKGK